MRSVLVRVGWIVSLWGAAAALGGYLFSVGYDPARGWRGSLYGMRFVWPEQPTVFLLYWWLGCLGTVAAGLSLVIALRR